ncbi:MAG: hypothetical protein QW123_04545 [Desulfurococcaceae archaeon]
MIVYARREKNGYYKVNVWSENGFPIATYSEVVVFVNEKKIDSDELLVEAASVRYFKEKRELYVRAKLTEL